MSSQPETLFKVKVKKHLDKIPNIWYEKIQQVTIRGTPDFLICYAGRFVAWELKKDAKSKATKLQQYELDGVAKAGGVAVVVHPGNLEEQLRLLVLLGVEPT